MDRAGAIRAARRVLLETRAVAGDGLAGGGDAPANDETGERGDHPALAELRRLDVLSLSPLEALSKLLDLQEQARHGL